MRNLYQLALSAVLVGSTFACGAPAGVTSSEGEQAESELLFGGRCVPSVGLGTRTYGLPESDSECWGQYGGHARVLGGDVTVPGLLEVNLDLVSTGDLPSTGGVRQSELLTLGLGANAIVSRTASAVAIGVGRESAAQAEVEALHIKLGLVNIDADVVKSRSEASCGSARGDSVVANLRINGVVVLVDTKPNQKIVSGIVNVTINEQVSSAEGVRTRALHISALGIADIVVAESEASFKCDCADSNSPRDDDDADDGQDAGKPHSDTVSFGGLGAKCDHAKACASGYSCSGLDVVLK